MVFIDLIASDNVSLTRTTRTEQKERFSKVVLQLSRVRVSLERALRNLWGTRPGEWNVPKGADVHCLRPSGPSLDIRMTKPVDGPEIPDSERKGYPRPDHQHNIFENYSSFRSPSRGGPSFRGRPFRDHPPCRHPSFRDPSCTCGP
jgi:hypothetical protein